MAHGIRLLILQFFSHLHALAAMASLHALNDDSFLVFSAVKQLQFIAPPLSTVFAFFFCGIVQLNRRV